MQDKLKANKPESRDLHHLRPEGLQPRLNWKECQWSWNESLTMIHNFNALLLTGTFLCNLKRPPVALLLHRRHFSLHSPSEVPLLCSYLLKNVTDRHFAIQGDTDTVIAPRIGPIIGETYERMETTTPAVYPSRLWQHKPWQKCLQLDPWI